MTETRNPSLTQIWLRRPKKFSSLFLILTQSQVCKNKMCKNLYVSRSTINRIKLYSNGTLKKWILRFGYSKFLSQKYQRRQSRVTPLSSLQTPRRERFKNSSEVFCVCSKRDITEQFLEKESVSFLQNLVNDLFPSICHQIYMNYWIEYKLSIK